MDDETRRVIQALQAEIAELRSRLDRADRNGLNNLYFRNLFPESGAGTNGTSGQAARADHEHA